MARFLLILLGVKTYYRLEDWYTYEFKIWLDFHRPSILTTILLVLTVVSFFVVSSLGIWFDYSGYVLSQNDFGLLITHIVTSIGPELGGIVIGIIIIDYLNGRRQDRTHKLILLRDIRFDDEVVRLRAIRELKHNNWLKGERLSLVNFENAPLTYANMRGNHFQGTNFKGASLDFANLRNTNLKQAILVETNLENANLTGANLESCDLTKANLIGANISNANLKGAILQDVKLGHKYLRNKKRLGKYCYVRLSDGTIMPDGRAYSDWKREGLSLEEFISATYQSDTSNSEQVVVDG